jgi:trk system potassium uptake protein TrkH
VIEFATLLICGLSPFDAAVHTMATAGTGGFSRYGDSIAHYNSVPVDIAITIFMFMFGVNFALYYKFLIGDRFKAFFRDEEFRWYFIFAVGFMLLVTLFNLDYYHGDFLASLRYGSFQISSVMSTTGFVTYDFNQWPAASHIIIVLAMLIGSCAGSTAGGIKVVRIIILSKLSRRNIRATGQPKKMEVIRLDGRAVEETMLSQIAQFVFMYITLILVGGLIMSIGSCYDITTNLSASLTCVSNVGPGLGAVGPVENYSGFTVHAKLTASLLMLFGRLELLPLFILFTRSAWHKY